MKANSWKTEWDHDALYLIHAIGVTPSAAVPSCFTFCTMWKNIVKLVTGKRRKNVCYIITFFFTNSRQIQHICELYCPRLCCKICDYCLGKISLSEWESKWLEIIHRHKLSPYVRITAVYSVQLPSYALFNSPKKIFIPICVNSIPVYEYSWSWKKPGYSYHTDLKIDWSAYILWAAVPNCPCLA